MKTQHLTIGRNQENNLVELLNQKLLQFKNVLRDISKNLKELSSGAGYALRH